MVAVGKQLQVVGVARATDAPEAAQPAPVEAVGRPSTDRPPKEVPVPKHPGGVGGAVVPPDRHPVVVEDDCVPRLARVHREVLRRHRPVADIGVVGEVVGQAAHVVAIELRASHVPHRDREGLPGAQWHHLGEVAAAKGMVADRRLPARGHVRIDRHRRVVAADDVVVGVGPERREEAGRAEAHLPGSRRLGVGPGGEERGDRERRGRHQGETASTVTQPLGRRRHRP